MIFDEPTVPATDRSVLKSDEERAVAATPQRRKPKWKWFKRVALGTFVLALSGWVTGALLLRSWTAKPPPIPPNASILQLKTQESDGRVWLGQSWVGHREGLLSAYLEGDPIELGYADGPLLGWPRRGSADDLSQGRSVRTGLRRWRVASSSDSRTRE